MATQANQGVVAPPHVPTPVARVRNFARMNPPEFHGSKVDEDAQKFIHEMYKILAIMGMSSEEKAELTAYQLKGVAHVCFTQQASERVDEGPIGREEFMLVFLDRVFPLEIREAKIIEFINL